MKAHKAWKYTFLFYFNYSFANSMTNNPKCSQVCYSMHMWIYIKWSYFLLQSPSVSSCRFHHLPNLGLICSFNCFSFALNNYWFLKITSPLMSACLCFGDRIIRGFDKIVKRFSGLQIVSCCWAIVIYWQTNHFVKHVIHCLK